MLMAVINQPSDTRLAQESETSFERPGILADVGAKSERLEQLKGERGKGWRADNCSRTTQNVRPSILYCLDNNNFFHGSTDSVNMLDPELVQGLKRLIHPPWHEVASASRIAKCSTDSRFISPLHPYLLQHLYQDIRRRQDDPST
jgi:hypothetical protein